MNQVSLKDKNLSTLLVYLELILLLILSSYFCFYKLGEASFLAEDETIHSSVAQEMIRSGDFLNAKFRGEDYFNKPLLKIWLTALTVNLLGESEFAYRALDATSGVIMTFLIYLFALRLFRSKHLAFFCSLFLLSCNLFYFGHGVRQAVQDSFMLMFDICALYCAYVLIEELLGQIDFKKALKLTIAGGVLTGLAIMCKGLGGAIVFPIVGVYALSTLRPIFLIKKAWYLVLIWVSLAALPLAIFIKLVGTKAADYLNILLIGEGWNRAVIGYHHVNHNWYYWKVIVSDGLTVPIISLVVGLIVVLLDLFSKNDEPKRVRALLFILSWGLVPIIFYQIVKSKLYWYIMPSIAGLSLICGYGLYRVGVGTVKNFQTKNYISTFSILLLCSFIPLVTHLNKIRTLISGDPKKDPVGELAVPLHSNDIQVVFGEMPARQTMQEIFYFSMFKGKKLESIDLETTTEPIVIFSDLASITNMPKNNPPTAYKLFRPRINRKSWIGALAYNVDGKILPGFKPWCQEFSLADLDKNSDQNYASGELNAEALSGKIAGNYFFKKEGARVTFDVKSDPKNMLIKILVRDQIFAEADFSKHSENKNFVIPNKKLQDKVIAFTLLFVPKDKTEAPLEISETFKSVSFCPEQSK